jgi:hypothetical protein
MRIRRVLRAVVALGVLTGCWAPDFARADHQPVIALPGNWQVPVVIHGIDATFGVVVGDWGLYAPGGANPTVLGHGIAAPLPREEYFPSTGRRPRQGRKEVERVRRGRAPPADFNRSWSAESGIRPPNLYPPLYPPPVIPAPRFNEEEFSPRPPE